MEEHALVPQVESKVRDPIVLVHGLFGFDKIKLGNWSVAEYFRGIPEALTAAGNRVFVARLSPVGCIAKRASQLSDFLKANVGIEPVHIFAHSMGGLDSRYLISQMGGADRVLSLTTLGTPHRGSCIADLALGILPTSASLQQFFRGFGLDINAVHDLSQASASEFNLANPDAPGVFYRSVMGAFDPEWTGRMRLLPHRYLTIPLLTAREGPNDGMVSVESARWGSVQEEWKGDHFNLVNWNVRDKETDGIHPDRRPDYLRLVQDLAKRGF